MPGLGVGLTYSPTPLFDLKAKKAVATSTTSSSRTPELTKLSLISADTGSKSTTTVSAAKVLSGAEKQSGVTVLASSPFSSVQYTPDHLRIICKSMFDMNEDEGEGDLPDNTTRLIPKLETPSKKIPLGFLSMSPFPGFDPGKVDRNAIMNAISAIYNMRIHTKSREKNMGADSGDGMTKDPYNILYGPKDDPLVPTGFTIEKNPVLWPNKNV